MKKSIGTLLGSISVVMIFCLACGGQAEKTTADSGAEVKQEQAAELSKPETAESKTETPDEIGQAVGSVYVEAMTKAIEMGKDHPPVEEIKPKLTELKNDCIAKLVELGKIKEGFTDEQKAKVNSTLRKKMAEVGRDMFTEYGNATNFYMDKDKETFNLFSSLNVITQYADFDLLKKQEPEEARRLGIE